MERGGKTIYGATLGILMLETRFPRIPGDIGHAATWPFPVQFRVVRGASPERVVLGDAEPLFDRFVEAGRDLVASGCDGIATNCGFLVPFQDRMADALGAPVASSSLIQAPLVARMLPAGRRIGVVTISAGTLGPRHMAAAGIPDGTPVVGTDPDGEFARKILGDAAEIDFDRARADVVEACQRLVAENPDVGAIILECTNMVPYARDVRRVTGLPVFSIYTCLLWFQAALLPRSFDGGIGDPRR